MNRRTTFVLLAAVCLPFSTFADEAQQARSSRPRPLPRIRCPTIRGLTWRLTSGSQPRRLNIARHIG